MTELNRFVDSKNLPQFTEILWEWVHLCERDARLASWNDASWWYNETTSVGMFAGAIWRSGGTALSDFTTKRFDVESVQRKATDKSRHGRGDLYFRVGQEEHYAEAKQVWSPFGVQADFRLQNIKTSFTKAFSQLDRLDEVTDEKKIALVFVVPYISKYYEKQVDQKLENWTRKLQNLEYDALAWTFPPETRRMEEKGRNSYFPGMALLIREFKHANSI